MTVDGAADFALFWGLCRLTRHRPWLYDNYDLSNDYCEGTDLDLSGAMDINDLEAFADNWLAGIAP